MLKRFLFSAALSPRRGAGRTHRLPSIVPTAARPAAAWTLSLNRFDSVYCYFVGTSTGQSAPAAAREAAYQDALRQISRHIVSEAGFGSGRLGRRAASSCRWRERRSCRCFYQRRLPGYVCR